MSIGPEKHFRVHPTPCFKDDKNENQKKYDSSNGT